MTSTYTTVGTRIALAVEGAVTALAIGSGWMALADGTAWETPGVVALAALMLFWGWRGARARVVEDGRGLVVHNVYRTHRIAWPDVVDVGWAEPWPYRIRMTCRCPYVAVRGRQYRVKLMAMLSVADHRFDDTVEAWHRAHG